MLFRSLGDVRLAGFEMHDLGDYPAAVAGEGSIAADVYELPSPAVLDVLDEAEGIHRKPPLYTRELVTALDAPAWLYVWAGDVPEGRRIESGDWRSR